MKHIRMTVLDLAGEIVAQSRQPVDEKQERAAVAKWLRNAARAKRACRITPVSTRTVTISLTMAEKLAAWLEEPVE